jgi:hypothetical protein
MTYLLTGNKTQTRLKVGYTPEGTICQFEMLGNWTDTQRIWVLSKLLNNIEFENRLMDDDITNVFKIEPEPPADWMSQIIHETEEMRIILAHRKTNFL